MTDTMTPKTEEVKTTYTDRLIAKFKSESQTDFDIDQIIELICEFKNEEDKARKSKADIVPVGRYKYKKVADVFTFDPQYLKWMLKQDWVSKYPEFVEEVKKYI